MHLVVIFFACFAPRRTEVSWSVVWGRLCVLVSRGAAVVALRF